ncbi:hypothetical protein [Salinigranum halophilum]|nr:hypothetical protein [Salinigranum halophilum]
MKAVVPLSDGLADELTYVAATPAIDDDEVLHTPESAPHTSN